MAKRLSARALTSLRMKSILATLIVFTLSMNGFAGVLFVRSNGITLTGADGVSYTGVSGITLTGADGLMPYTANGITLTGADGITLTGADAVTSTAADGITYTGANGITLTGADGITLTGADGITLTGADGITLTGADGTVYRADGIVIRMPDGITLTGADGITLTGADGITLTGADGLTRTGVNAVSMAAADGITLTGADGITLTGADGITLTGADGFTGIGPAGILFENNDPAGITLTGADGITLTGADGITLTGADGITLTGADAAGVMHSMSAVGMQGLDPELALALNTMTDDSTVNAIVTYHRTVTDSDIDALRSAGILGGTRMKVLPAVYVTATRSQIAAVSRQPAVRSIYGNRTLTFNADPYFNATGIQRVGGDPELRQHNGSVPVDGRDVTVAVLDTGINAAHPDLAGKVVQNVRLADVQSVPSGFMPPLPVEGLVNTDLGGGHGTFVAGIIAGSGAASSGRYAGVAPGAKLLGLSAGDVNLISVLSGFDYLLDKGSLYNVRVVNCSFSAATVYDENDPVNIATQMLTERGVNVVFSAGNTGPGNGTLNPYAVAPWVIGVGATDESSRLASFSSRGDFGDPLQHPFISAPGVSVIGPRSAASLTSVGGIVGADPSRLSGVEALHYTTASGTSFSAPQAAGAIALMLDARPTLSPAEVRDILGRTATPLPKYFYHEAGAGMLNTHAAVVEAAFPERRMGGFRSAYSKNNVRFVTTLSNEFVSSVFPYAASSSGVTIPSDTLQASITIAWGLGLNDFGLKVFGQDGNLLGQSNATNLPGLTSRSEKVALRSPSAGTVRAEVHNSFGIGTTQNVATSLVTSRAIYPELQDLSNLSAGSVDQIRSGLLSGLIFPDGRKFRPYDAVPRLDLAAALLRTGQIPQYMRRAAQYADVRDAHSRGIVESVQSDANGRIILNIGSGDRFYPYNPASKLMAAVAFVRTARLENAAATALLPVNVADAMSIPSEYRGHVAVALQHGFISLDGNHFRPSRSLSRLELTYAVNRIAGL